MVLSAQEVREALAGRGLADAVAGAFLDAGIDGNALLVMEKADLKDELGLSSLADRKRAWAAVCDLRAQIAAKAGGPAPKRTPPEDGDGVGETAVALQGAAKRPRSGWVPPLGSRVIAQGLVKAKELNGEEGVVVRSEGDRFVVNFEWLGEKSLRPENMRPAPQKGVKQPRPAAAPAPAPPPRPAYCPFVGDKVTVYGLDPADPFNKALNGESGMVTAVAPGKVTVEFQAKPPFDRVIPPGNLRPYGVKTEEEEAAEKKKTQKRTRQRLRAAKLRQERKVDTFEVGMEAEVVILAGTFKNKWVPCRILAEDMGDKYTIYVLPTDRYGGAAGAAGKRICGVKARHLRKKRERSSLPPGERSIFDGVQEDSVMGKYWDQLTYIQKRLCIENGIVPQPPTITTDIWETVDNVNRARLADSWSLDHPGQLIIGRDPEPAGKTQLAQTLRGLDSLWAGVGDDDGSSVATESGASDGAGGGYAIPSPRAPPRAPPRPPAPPPDYAAQAQAFMSERSRAEMDKTMERAADAEWKEGSFR
eukprot:TRINITY_DN18445_c0_g3_i1.p1 TRINITY_DN18445_c0_g3~~TRINITY_DN18445_c0_g3_i1.p1  ORF type:complete len:559 (+),score=163.49 TRINITY_DN18445_c0_g3_i1:82-1677(+)